MFKEQDIMQIADLNHKYGTRWLQGITLISPRGRKILYRNMAHRE